MTQLRRSRAEFQTVVWLHVTASVLVLGNRQGFDRLACADERSHDLFREFCDRVARLGRGAHAFAYMAPESSKSETTVHRYFVDEAGDLTFFDRRGRALVGS